MMWLMSFSIKAACLLAMAWTVALVLRRSPADVRHRLWATALLGVAVLALPITLPTAVQIATPVQFQATALANSAQTGSMGWLEYWRTIWMVGAALFAVRLLTGLARVAWWTRKARRSGEVLLSEHAATPLTWGFFRPVILFPPYSEAWTPQQRELALLHEQAHVDRNDWLFQMIASTVQAVFWFHPLVWMACFQMRREAEAAADDRVLQSGADPSDYAAQLLVVARSMAGRTPLAAVPMTARQGLLESRVRAILDRDRLREQATLLARAGMSALVCACVGPLLAMQANSVLPRSVSGSLAVTRPATLLPDAGPPSTANPARVRRDEAAQTNPNAATRRSQPEPPQMDSPPRVLYKREPAYTEEARAAKVQGTVVLTLTITEQGRAAEIRVARSLDPGLDRQAMEAIEEWQFAPATKNGTPVRTNSTIEVNFRIL